jgi:hypothetical protein
MQKFSRLVEFTQLGQSGFGTLDIQIENDAVLGAAVG